jgi:hypothetical protein
MFVIIAAFYIFNFCKDIGNNQSLECNKNDSLTNDNANGRLGPDPYPGLNEWLYINCFGVCKSHKYFRNLCFITFWVIILFRAHFLQK